MGCFEGDDAAYNPSDEYGNQAGTVLTGVPMQGTVARKIGLCGGKKKSKQPAYYSNVRPWDPLSEDYSSPSLEELDYMSPATMETNYNPK